MVSSATGDTLVKDVGIYLFDDDDTLRSAFGGYTVGSFRVEISTKIRFICNSYAIIKSL